MSSIWEILEIEPTLDKREIRRAYAALSKTYHVEEFPEEFAKIQKAYHAALEYAAHNDTHNNDNKNDRGIHDAIADTSNDAMAVNMENIQRNTENPILSRLEQQCAGQHISYSNEEVIAQIKELLIKQTSADWQDFFLSEAFLAVHDKEEFAGELRQALSNCGEISDTGLEPAFLSGLAAVYGIISFDDIGNYDSGNKAAVGNLLLEQDNTEWLMAGQTAQRVSIGYSFYSFRRLCQIAKEGGLKDYQQEKWGNLSFYAENNYIPKMSAADGSKWQLRLENVIEPYAPACVAMHRYLIRHYNIPENVCHAMRNNFEIDGRLGEYPLCSYQAVYDVMCRKYPHMEQSETAKLTDWKLGLLSGLPVSPIQRKYAAESGAPAARGAGEETIPVQFKKALNVEIMEWLKQVWKVRQCPEGLTQEAYNAYKNEGHTALALLEVLIGHLVECRNQSLDNCISEKELAGSVQISVQNPCFWHYFFGTVYPYTNDGQEWRESDYHFALSLYMKQVYPVSAYFSRHFFQKEIQPPKDSMHYVLCAGKTEKTIFFDEKEVRLVFTPHHVEYFIQGVRVFYQILSFAQLSALPESEEGNLTFFLLLPIAKVSADAKCRDEVLRRLKYLPFYEPTWDYLADCMVRNTDWETEPEHPQKMLEEVYYSEDAWHCFRGRLTGRRFTVEYKTPKGWYPMKLLNGESKNTRAIEDKTERICFMHKVVDGFLPPEPKPLKEISVRGKMPAQKAEAVFNAMLESRRMLGVNFTVTLWFRERETDVPRLCYMYVEEQWNAANLRLEITGEQKNVYLNREERLKCIIGEPADIVGYFRLEDVFPFPVGIGESGTFYTYFDHRLVAERSYPKLIAKCINLENLYKIEIDDGVRTVDLFTRKLENWYMHRYNRETKEHEQNYPFEVYRELFDEL